MRWWGGALLAWVALAPPLGVLVGRMIRARQGEPCEGCGHARQAHEHYRSGSDCALCDCPQYARARPRWRTPLSVSRSARRWVQPPVPRPPPG